MNLSRRDFLRASAVTALGTAVACGGSPAPKTRTLSDIAGKDQPALQLVLVGTQLLSGRPQRFAFGLFDPRLNQPVPNLTDVKISYGAQKTSTANGPFAATYHGDGLGDRGIYEAMTSFPADGTFLAVVEFTINGARATSSFGTFQVGRRHAMPIVGERAPAPPTPTFDNARGVSPICTQKPKPCSMHDVSLDKALKNGKPTIVVLATPQFCQTALCGPEVEIVDAIRTENGEGINFVHIENYKDDKPETIQRVILSPAAAAWRLEEEPAIYAIGADGIIVDVALGPVDRADVRAIASALKA